MGHQDLIDAVLALKRESFQLGDAWQRAHELAQAHEGQARYDRLHAFLHRIEQDGPNAAYWYRRSDTPFFEGDFESEGNMLIEAWRDG